MSHARLDETRAAEFLGVAPGTLANWRWRGAGPPFIKLGRRVVYDVRDLERFLTRNRRASTSARTPAAGAAPAAAAR